MNNMNNIFNMDNMNNIKNLNKNIINKNFNNNRVNNNFLIKYTILSKSNNNIEYCSIVYGRTKIDNHIRKYESKIGINNIISFSFTLNYVYNWDYIFSFLYVFG